MNIRDFLTEKQVEFQLIDHEPTFDAQHMAQSVHVSGRMVAKPVLLRANHGFRYLTAIIPASAQVDFEIARHSLGDSRLELATEDEVNTVCADCEPGVLPPFGSQYGVRTVVDTSLSQVDEIVFEGDFHSQAVRMKYADFRQLELPLVVPLTRQSFAAALSDS